MGTETSVLAPRRRAVSGGSFHGQSSAIRDGSSNKGYAEAELHQRRYQDDRPDPVRQPHFHGATSVGLRTFLSAERGRVR